MGEESGMHIVAGFPGMDFTRGLLHRFDKYGVNVISVEEHAIIKGRRLNQLVLGYAHLCPAEIEEGVARLKRAIESQ